ncbi:NUDIX domain-containing protein [bacterium]|nr:NUDIX domain-containing protein [bacterium]
MNKEILKIYNLKGKFLKNQERKKFYREIKKEFSETGQITKQVKRFTCLLMNSSGRIYLQKRSKLKKENSGLHDKTVGGHVTGNDTFNMTIIRECAEELGFPASILSKKEFDESISKTHLNIVALFRKVDYITNFKSTRIAKNNQKFIQPYINTTYIGYYDGPIKFIDGESSGIEVFSLKELEKKIKEKPEKFTEDTKFMIKKYRKYLKPIK